MSWLLLAFAALAWAAWWGLDRYDAGAAPLPPLCGCATRRRCLAGRWHALVAAAGALAEEPTRRTVGAAAAHAGAFLAGLAGRQRLRVPYDEPYWAEMAANFARSGGCCTGGVLVGRLEFAPARGPAPFARDAGTAMPAAEFAELAAESAKLAEPAAEPAAESAMPAMPVDEPAVGRGRGPGPAAGPEREPGLAPPGSSARFSIRWGRECRTAAVELFGRLGRGGGFDRGYGLLIVPGGSFIA